MYIINVELMNFHKLNTLNWNQPTFFSRNRALPAARSPLQVAFHSLPSCLTRRATNLVSKGQISFACFNIIYKWSYTIWTLLHLASVNMLVRFTHIAFSSINLLLFSNFKYTFKNRLFTHSVLKFLNCLKILKLGAGDTAP